MTQPKTGRRRQYCRRTCRDYAYVSRRTQRLIDEAVDQALGKAPLPELPTLPAAGLRGESAPPIVSSIGETMGEATPPIVSSIGETMGGAGETPSGTGAGG